MDFLDTDDLQILNQKKKKLRRDILIKYIRKIERQIGIVTTHTIIRELVFHVPFTEDVLYVTMDILLKSLAHHFALQGLSTHAYTPNLLHLKWK